MLGSVGLHVVDPRPALNLSVRGEVEAERRVTEEEEEEEEENTDE